MSSFSNISPLLMRQIIIGHYNSPTNPLINYDKDNRTLIIKENDGVIEYTIYKKSQTCIDELFVYIAIKDDVIINALFKATACSIATAGIDILCDLLKNKNITEVIKIIDNYRLLINGKKYDSDKVGEAICLANTYKIPLRIKCATIGLEGVTDILKKFNI